MRRTANLKLVLRGNLCFVLCCSVFVLTSGALVIVKIRCLTVTTISILSLFCTTFLQFDQFESFKETFLDFRLVKWRVDEMINDWRVDSLEERVSEVSVMIGRRGKALHSLHPSRSCSLLLGVRED